MEQEKQIEEMARDICECYDNGICYQDDKPCDLRCEHMTEAQFLYDKGYRKERQGEWIKRENKSPTQIEAYCSICGRDAVYQVIDNRWQFENYCPHCGACMTRSNANE